MPPVICSAATVAVAVKLAGAGVNEPFDIGRQLVTRQRGLHGVGAVADGFRDDGACIADDEGIVAGTADERNSAQAAVVQNIGAGAAVQGLVDRAGCQGIGYPSPEMMASPQNSSGCRWRSFH